VFTIPYIKEEFGIPDTRKSPSQKKARPQIQNGKVSQGGGGVPLGDLPGTLLVVGQRESTYESVPEVRVSGRIRPPLLPFGYLTKITYLSTIVTF
jgi:hypothetical protein